MIEDHCNVPPGWADGSSRRIEAGHRVVGGSIRNVARHGASATGPPSSASTARFMEPCRRGRRRPARDERRPTTARRSRRSTTSCASGPLGDLAAPAAARARLRALVRAGAVLDHAKDFGFREFVSQRYHYSRSYAGMRNRELGRRAFALRARLAAARPARVPADRAERARAAGVRGGRSARATPLILLYTVVWAFGEAVGYVFGGGRSILQGALTMRVGVDATSWDNRRGFGRFTRNAVGRLVELDAETDVRASSRRRERRRRADLPARRARLVSARARRRRGSGRGLEPHARRPRSPGARRPARPARRLSLPVASTRTSRCPACPTVVGVHDTIADEHPSSTFPSRREPHALAAQAAARDRDARRGSSPSRRPRAPRSRADCGIPAERLAVVPEAPDPVF